jgi:peptide/nickel transport system ATP-binding protein
VPTKPEASTQSGTPTQREALVEVRDLQVHFAIRGGVLGRLAGRSSGAVKAVDGVSFTLHRGEVLGLVGESGSGKTTLSRALLGLVPATGGSIRYAGTEITGRSERSLRPMRSKMQMVFQDPHAALNPAMDIATAIAHPLRIHRTVRSRAEIDNRVRAALERVGLAPPEQFMTKYPGDLSGGQKQRAVLARAIMLGPELLVADEPVSMLDMSVRAKILDLMIELRRALDLTYIYITHDLATAKFFCDTIAIMYLGRIVEIGPAEQIYAAPQHPYTKALLAAIPEPDPTRGVPRNLPRGEIPDAAVPPLGCSFHPRCPVAFDRCGWESRDLRILLEQHWLELPVEQYNAERAVVGDLAGLDLPATECVLPAARGRTGADVADLLRTVRDAHPDEVFWRGVAGTEVLADGVRVLFHQGTDPRLRNTDRAGVRAACLLYDSDSDA